MLSDFHRLDALALTLPVTRITLPPPPPALLARRRLFALLTPPALPMMTMVAAPAGYGKTTLVASWLVEYRQTAAWLTLDPADDSPPAFWSAILAALRERIAISADSVGGTQLLASSAELTPDQRRATLINGLAALREPATLVLDDYQVITSAEVHSELAWLIEHLPPTMHLVLVSRGIPPLPLARLRARGRLRELNALDLRFSDEEARTFLRAVAGPSLASEVAAALAERAGGWPAGLHLTALSLRAQESDHALAHDLPVPELLAAGDPFMFTYLVDEVVAAQPPDVREFLLRTSILDALCGDLCAELLMVAPEVAPAQSAIELLETVERAQLFLTPFGSDRRWFRYHPLFAEALRGQLQRYSPDLARLLHRRAGVWFAARDELSSAVRHMLAAGESIAAAELLEQAGGRMLATGQALAWLGLVTGVPDAVLLARPQLLAFNAWALALTGAAERSERYLQLVERGLPRLDAPTRVEIRCQAAMIRAQRAALAGDAELAIRMSREAIAQAPPEGELRAALAYILGSVMHMCGRSGEATRLLADNAPALAELSDPALRVGAVIALGESLEIHGALRRAEAIYQDVVARTGDRLALARVAARLGLSRIALSRWQLAEARTSANLALHEAVRNDLDDLALQVELTLFTLTAAQGDAPDPAALLALDKRLARVTPPVVHAYLAARRALLALAMRDFRAARSWLNRAKDQQRHSPLERDMFVIVGAMLTLASGDAAGAVIEELERLQADAAAGERGRTRIEALTLLALAAYRGGRTELAVRRLREALALAAPEGIIQPFVTPVLPLQPLLAMVLPRLSDDLPLWEFAGLLMSQGANAAQPASEPLLEPLNPREREVLHLVAAGQPNRAIGAALHIAEGTVKKHLYNIYGKLGVASRTQALARARALGLLEAEGN